MNFDEIVNDIITLRFKSGSRPMVERWVNIRYGMIWSTSDWPFKFVIPQSFLISADNAAPQMPGDFHRVRPNGLRDSSGNPLMYLPPRDFSDAFNSSTQRGVPTSYTVSGEQIYVGPIPSSDITFNLAYERKVAHRDAAGIVVAGPLVVGSDSPIWDPMHHFILVPGAMATGLKLENDPTWPPLEDEFERLLMGMVNYYLPPDAVGNSQYGADNLGYESVY